MWLFKGELKVVLDAAISRVSHDRKILNENI
jgi:hypothetical protein